MRHILDNIRISQKLWLLVMTATATIAIGILASVFSSYAARKHTFVALEYSSTITEALNVARKAETQYLTQVNAWQQMRDLPPETSAYLKHKKTFEDSEDNVEARLNELKHHYKVFDLAARKLEKAQKMHGELTEKMLTVKASRDLTQEKEKFHTLLVDLIDIVKNAQKKLVDQIEEKTSQTYALSYGLNGGLGVIAFGFLFSLSYFCIRSINRPIQQTRSVFEAISREELGNDLESERADEIGDMWRSLSTMQRRLKENSQEIREANQKLTESLEQVKHLKEQQDGDYFLTSILTDSLNKYNAQSDYFATETYLQQKKSFQFRKWSRQIGGDIIITDQLQLQDRKHLVLLNGDAMGKSLQGAGGSLILGSVFLSILERSKLAPQAKRDYPEKWLRNAVLELQKVFETFDGSMLVSANIALVDETSGLMYQVNAEHPYPVLYRDRKAQFLESSYQLRKLGHLEANLEIFVDSFKIRPEDVIFMGSDGRDDLLLGYHATGERSINDDEEMFLRAVESAQADQDDLIETLQQQGEFTDDISLIRLECCKTPVQQTDDKAFSMALRKTRKNPEEFLETARTRADELEYSGAAQYQLALFYLEQKDYNRAFTHAQKSLTLDASGNNKLYLLSYLAKIAGFLETAIREGERLRLRDPLLIKNLINLADAHTLDKNYSRAQEILDEIFALEPDNDKGLRIHHALQEKIKARPKDSGTVSA